MKKAFVPFKTLPIVYIFFFIGLTTLSIFNLSLFIPKKPTVIQAETNPVEKKILFWESFLESNPDYFEGWLELAKLELKAGNIKRAEVAISKAWVLNPNSPDTMQVKSEIESMK